MHCPKSGNSIARVRRTKRRGLSLLEAILATGIFIASMALIGELLQLGLLATRSNRETTIALLRCESKMEELVAGIESLELVDEAIPFPEDPNWQWMVEVEPTEVEGLLWVSVVVERLDENDEPDLEQRLTRLMTDPSLRDLLVARSEQEGERVPVTIRRLLGLGAPEGDE